MGLPAAAISRATPVFWVSALVVALVAFPSIRNAVLWYERPIPGLLIDASGAISSIGLPSWATKRLNLQFPDRIVAAGHEVSSGSRRRVEAWDQAVRLAYDEKYLEATVVGPGQTRSVRLPMRPMEPLAWWVYGASPIFAGLLYAAAGLVALWASPKGRLARAFARFAICSGLFLLTLFDVHTERALTPLFFVTYALEPISLILLMLHLPVSVRFLESRRRLESIAVGTFALLGAIAAGTHWMGGDVVRFQVLFTALFGLALAVSVAGFLVRYAYSRGEQQQTLRALLISMIPPYAGTSVAMLLASRGVLRDFRRPEHGAGSGGP